MSFSELPAETQQKLFDELQGVYDAFEDESRDLPAPRSSCAGCGRCCVGPPLYMTCSDLEFAYARQYARERHLDHRVHFEEAAPDRRHAYGSWTCPFYSHFEGCTVYPNRPFACRVFGRYARERIEWAFCGYQDVAVHYDDPRELPVYERYRELLSSYPARRGYVYPDALSYTRPTVELLMGMVLPWAPLMNVRIAL